MKALNEIKSILEQHKDILRNEYNVVEISLFGSYVHNTQTDKSDLDIFVEFDIVPGLLQFIKLENYLTELLGVKVDLVRKKSIRKELKEKILNEAISL